MLRTAVAVSIVVLYFAVIIEGIARGGQYGPAVTAMIPVLTIAVGFLLGRDMVEIFVTRRQVKEESEDDRATRAE